ncbi:MAG: hypothetical protein RID07_05045, partial [Lacipirellulaceae bacterium]
MSRLRNLVGCACVVALFAQQAQADLVTPTAVSASSEFAAAVNLINGSGLDGVGPVPGQLHNNDENGMWKTFSATPIGESVEFTLAGTYDLSAAYIWQYNGPSGGTMGLPEPDREVGSLDIAISPNLVDPFVSIGTLTLAAAQDQTVIAFNEPAQTFALGSGNIAQRVKLTILSSQIPGGDTINGLSEVRFEGRLIPEPASFALGAIGLLALANGGRRR